MGRQVYATVYDKDTGWIAHIILVEVACRRWSCSMRGRRFNGRDLLGVAL